MKYLELQNQDPHEHTALEAMIYDKKINVLAAATLDRRTVFMGYDVDYSCFKENEDVDVVRYVGTGGPVYFEKGNLKFIFMTDTITDAIKKTQEWIVGSLATIGIQTTYSGNDVYFNGFKFCGVGFRDLGNKLILPFFITFTIDYAMAEKSMHLVKHGGDIKTRAKGLNDQLDYELTGEEVLTALRTNYEKYWGGKLEKVSLNNLVEAEELKKMTKEFSTEKWIKNGQL